MNEKSVKTLKALWHFCLWGTGLVIILAVISLLVRDDFLRDLALGISIAGTLFVTYATAKVINSEKDRSDNQKYM